MKTVVLKFGGTSVGSIERIKKIANIIATYKDKKLGVIVVSSAMSGTTNNLIKQTQELSENFDQLNMMFYYLQVSKQHAH